MPTPETSEPDGEPDGRRRRGHRRRRTLLDAALRVVGRDGAGGVTQRAVAAEAGLPPSAVYYYFATIDDLVAAVLTDVNDRYLAAFAALPEGPDPVPAFAALVEEGARAGRDEALAEVELWLLAARRPALRPELERWDAGLRAAARRLSTDPVALEAVVDLVHGRYVRGLTAPAEADLTLALRRVTGRS